MPSLKRSHTVYLQSKKRQNGTPSNYIIPLPNVIESDPNLEKFKISLQNFSTYNSWYLVKEGSNTVWIDGVMHTIPHGTYTYYRLGQELSRQTGGTVTWLQDSNKMAFNFPTSKSITFDGLGGILGFDPNTIYSGTQIISDRPMKPLEDTHILIHLNNISPMTEHLCFSNHSGEVRFANIVGKVLINSPPFQLITYQQVLDNEGLYSNDNSMTSLEIYITDNDGNEFVDMTEHEMVFTIESVDFDDYNAKDIINELKEIKKGINDLLLMKHLQVRTYR
jgi:hypothetical protein